MELEGLQYFAEKYHIPPGGQEAKLKQRPAEEESIVGKILKQVRLPNICDQGQTVYKRESIGE